MENKIVFKDREEKQEEELPSSYLVLATLFNQERSNPERFYKAALQYARAGEWENYRGMLREGINQASESGQEGKREGVRLLVSMAIHKTGSGEEKELLKQAEIFDVSNTLVWTGKALQHHRKEGGEQIQQQALAYCETALCLAPNNVMAKHLKAQLLLTLQEYHKSYLIFQECFRKAPFLHPSCRLGISFCLFFLGQKEKAKNCFIRCFEHDRCSRALYALAVIDWNEGGSNYPAFLRLLEQETKSDLDSQLFIRELQTESSSKKELLTYLTLSLSQRQLAQVKLLCAKLEHKTGNKKEAKQYYKEALATTETIIKFPALVGLAQLFLEENKPQKAQNCLAQLPQEVLELNCLLPLRCYLSVVTQPDFSQKDLTLLQQLLKARTTKSILTLCSYGLIRNHSKEALSIYRTLSRETDLALQNNMAVCYLLSDQRREAISLLEESRRQPFFKPDLHITLLFNLSLAYLEEGDYFKAQEISTFVFSFRKFYPDAFFLSAAISLAGSHFQEGIDVLGPLLQREEHKTEALLCLSTLLQKRGDSSLAEQLLEEELKQKEDSLLFLQLGSLLLTNLKHEKRESPSWKRILLKAFECFQKAFQMEPKMFQSLNGISVLLAECRLFREAKELLLFVRETPKAPVDILLNLGSVLIELGSYQMALKTLHRAQQLYPELRPLELTVLLAKTHYILAKASSDVSSATKALQKAEEALQHYPPKQAWIGDFNLALCLQGFLSLVVTTKNNERILEAQSYGKKALQILATLQQKNPPKKIYRNEDTGKVLKERSNYISSLLRQLDT